MAIKKRLSVDFITDQIRTALISVSALDEDFDDVVRS